MCALRHVPPQSRVEPAMPSRALIATAIAGALWLTQTPTGAGLGSAYAARHATPLPASDAHEDVYERYLASQPKWFESPVFGYGPEASARRDDKSLPSNVEGGLAGDTTVQGTVLRKLNRLKQATDSNRVLALAGFVGLIAGGFVGWLLTEYRQSVAD